MLVLRFSSTTVPWFRAIRSPKIGWFANPVHSRSAGAALAERLRMPLLLVACGCFGFPLFSYADEPKPDYPSLEDCVRDDSLSWRKIARRANERNPWCCGGKDVYQRAREGDLKAVRAFLSTSFGGGRTLTETTDRGQLLHCALDPRGHPDAVRSLEADAARLQTVELLIRLGADVNAVNGRGETPLQLAVVDGNEAIVRKLLEAGSRVNGHYAAGAHPVQLAVAAGSIPITELLMDAGADINPDNDEVDYGDPPLALALRNADVEMVRFLLLRLKEEGEKPLGSLHALLRPLVKRPLRRPVLESRKREAADRLTLARILLKAGAKPTAVHEAAAANHTEIMKLLLDAGGDPNRANKYLSWEMGRTPLHEAVCHANPEIVAALLDKGADIAAATNAKRCQAIHYAILPGGVSMGHPNPWPENDSDRVKIVKALIQAGADPEAPAFERRTPLHFAVSSGNPEMVALLLDNGADANAVTRDGVRPLHRDGFPNALAIAKLLVEHGADVEAVHGRLGGKPIHYAARRGEIELVEYLLDRGVKVDSSDKGSWAKPIHYAAGSGQVAMVEFLIKRGAKIDALTFTKDQPLHYAARSGWLKTVRYLLKHGANPRAMNSHGETPLFWARIRNQTSCIPELEKYEHSSPAKK